MLFRSAALRQFHRPPHPADILLRKYLRISLHKKIPETVVSGSSSPSGARSRHHAAARRGKNCTFFHPDSDRRHRNFTDSVSAGLFRKKDADRKVAGYDRRWGFPPRPEACFVNTDANIVIFSKRSAPSAKKTKRPLAGALRPSKINPSILSFRKVRSDRCPNRVTPLRPEPPLSSATPRRKSLLMSRNCQLLP